MNCLEMQEQPSYIREVEVALIRREEIKKLKVGDNAKEEGHERSV
jgi:hypothetical protein